MSPTEPLLQGGRSGRFKSGTRIKRLDRMGSTCGPAGEITC